MDDAHAILIVDDSALFHVVELMHDRIVTFANRPSVEAVLMPGGHLHHVLDHMSSAILRFGAAGAIDVQWRPSSLYGPEHREVREVSYMIRV